MILCVSLLNACAAGDNPTQTAALSQPPATEENASPAPDGDLQTTPATDTGPDLASGYQFVAGYGIIAPGSPRVYQKDPAFRPTMEEDDALGELLYAVYQDGVFRYQYKVKDTSIELIPGDEVEELLKKDFAIDEEAGIYGRSSYESRTGMRQQDGAPQTGPFISSITGKDLPEAGYTQKKGTIFRDYEEFLEKGCVNTYGEYLIECNQPEGWIPDETYQLHIAGFRETADFTFSPAPEYAALEEIPGITKIGDYWILAQAEIKDGEIRLTTYAWPKEGYKLTNLIDQKLEYQSADGSGVCASKLRSYSIPGGNTLKGIAAGTQGTFSFYELPDAAVDAEFTLTAPIMLVSSEETTEKTTIPVPPDSRQQIQLDQQIRLKDCTIRLTGVRRGGEDLLYGRDGNEEIMRPVLYVDFEVEARDGRMELDWFQGRKKEEGEGEALTLYPQYEDVTVPLTKRKIKDLLVLYEAGSEEVSFRIDYVVYRLRQDVRAPVLMEE